MSNNNSNILLGALGLMGMISLYVSFSGKEQIKEKDNICLV